MSEPQPISFHSSPNRDYAVVIPTKDRPYFLMRTVKWYERHDVPILLGNYPFMNELQAAYAAATSACSPFVAFAGDDDFLVPSALDTFAAILHQKPFADAVTGRCALFVIRDDQVYGRLESVNEHPDELFRLYRHGVFMRALEAAKDRPTAHERGLTMLQWLNEHAVTVRLPDLYLFRQGHAGRVTARLHPRPKTRRERLGYLFPRLQYACLCARTPCWYLKRTCPRCALTLPGLRKPDSPYHATFADVYAAILR